MSGKKINAILSQSREVNEDDEDEDEGFRDVEEILETAMSLKERRHEYRKLLGVTTGKGIISYMTLLPCYVSISRNVQGDTSRRYKPPVHTKTKVVF